MLRAAMLFVGAGAVITAIVIMSATPRVPSLYYVVFDSCGYQLSRDIIERYPELNGTVIDVTGLSSLGEHGDVLVFLYSNASLPVNIPEIGQSMLDNSVVTDLFAEKFLGNSHVAAGEIESDAIIRYCTEGDEGSLDYIASKIREVARAGASPPAPPILLLSVGAAALAGAALSQKAEDIAEKARSLLIRTLGLVVFSILGSLYKRPEDVINSSPARKAIWEYVNELGAVRFSQLLKKFDMPRGTLEWHIFLLAKFGLLKEIRIRRKRYIVDPNNKEKAAESLIELCPEARCVYEELSKNSPALTKRDIEAIRKKCNISEAELRELLELFR